METYELNELTQILEEEIRTSIQSTLPHYWDENFITQRILSGLQTSLSSIFLNGKDFRRRINWETYKLRGHFETNYGDIALVVNISGNDGTSLNGVAFLEAKRRDWRKQTFSAINKKQREKIVKNAPRAQYLLYDYEDITNFIRSQHETLYYNGRKFPAFTERTHSVCVPLNLAGALGFKDTFLYKYGIPFSKMLTNRYFQGLDLEFSKTATEIATGYLTKFGLPKYVMHINISEGYHDDPNEKHLTLNRDVFQKID